LDDLLRAGLRLLPAGVPSRGSRHLSGLLHSVHRLLNRRSLRHLLLDGLRLAGLSGQIRKLKTARLHGEHRLLLDDFEHVSPVLVKVLVLGLERVDLPPEVLPKLGLHVMLVHGAEKLAQRLTNHLAFLLKEPPRHTLRELLHDLRPFGFQLVQELFRAYGGLRLSELLCRVLCSGLLIALHRLRLLEVGQELLVLLLQRTKLLALLPELALKLLVTALQVLRGLVFACPQLGRALVQELFRAYGGLRLSELLCRVLCSGLLIALHRLRLLEVGQELLVLLLQRTKLLALLPELALKLLVTALQVLRGLVFACP